MNVNLDILNAYIEGNLTSEEISGVEKILNENQEWRDEYALLLDIHNATLKYQYPESARIETAWQKVKPSTPVRRLLPWMAAASVVLIVISFWLFYPDGKEKFIAKTDVRLELPDGSIAFLQKGSAIIIETEDYLKNRTVQMKGDVSFQVVSDIQNPFTVKYNHLSVVATGTRFRVSTLQDEINVSLFSGKLQVSNGSKTTNLTAGQSVKAVRDNFYKSELLSDPAGFIYSLNLEDTEFSKIAEHIEKRFEIQLIYPLALRNQKFTIRAEGMKLEEIILLMNTLTGEHITYQGKDS